MMGKLATGIAAGAKCASPARVPSIARRHRPRPAPATSRSRQHSHEDCSPLENEGAGACESAELGTPTRRLARDRHRHRLVRRATESTFSFLPIGSFTDAEENAEPAVPPTPGAADSKGRTRRRPAPPPGFYNMMISPCRSEWELPSFAMLSARLWMMRGEGVCDVNVY